MSERIEQLLRDLQEAVRDEDRATIARQADVIERLKRALPDCEACAGTGKIEHEAVYTGPNPHSACVETCDACEGLGVEL